VTLSPAMIGEAVRGVMSLDEDQPLEIVSIVRGGSARSFYRVRYGGQGASLVFVHYSSDRRENKYYAALAGFLQDAGIAVPRILHHDAVRGFLLLEDLGEDDLWHHRREAWDRRRKYYFQTLEMIRKLHMVKEEAPRLAGIPLMEAFDLALYRWERQYFLEHFVRGVCGIELKSAEAEALEGELALLAEELAGMPSCLIHRDLQSQNVMIRGGAPVLIDFQGMRFGHPCYDLGSLLYDPYVSFSGSEREELLQHYYNAVPCPGFGLDHFREIFRQAAVQRLMQALGAYGFLGRQRSHPEFLGHIPSGLANLIEAAERNPRLSRIRKLALRCRERLNA